MECSKSSKVEKSQRRRCLTYNGLNQALHYVFGEEGEGNIDNFVKKEYQVAFKIPGNLCWKRGMEVDNFEMVTQEAYDRVVEQRDQLQAANANLTDRFNDAQREIEHLRNQDAVLINTNAILAGLLRDNQNMQQQNPPNQANVYVAPQTNFGPNMGPPPYQYMHQLQLYEPAQQVQNFGRRSTGKNLLCIYSSRSTSSGLTHNVVNPAAVIADLIHRSDLKCKGKKVYLIGSHCLKYELDVLNIDYFCDGTDLEGIQPASNSQAFKLEEQSESLGAVVVGFDRYFSFLKLMKAANYLKNEDCLFFATTEEETCPFPNLTTIGAAPLVAAVKTASGREPLIVGKSSAPAFEYICRRWGVDSIDPRRTLMIGDRVNTDVKFGRDQWTANTSCLEWMSWVRLKRKSVYDFKNQVLICLDCLVIEGRMLKVFFHLEGLHFGPVIWSRSEQIIVSIDKNEFLKEENCTNSSNNTKPTNSRLRLQCKASGFPTPRYQWLDDDRQLEGANQSSLIILRCPCTARNVFRCKVWNLVEEGNEWSEFYRDPGKTFYSELISNIVDLTSFAVPFDDCENCYKQKMEELAKRLGNEQTIENNDNNINLNEDDPMITIATEKLIASDKVALIISNRSYAPNMTNLITPHCDAETLAGALQQLNFKTVTLGDLNLIEMKQMINAYKKLLGEGVYAIFYFAGHGFEANGQCYLLPIGAPANGYGPKDCLSMDLVMSEFREFSPSLNLILLDMCRKFLPLNIDAFVAYSERFRQGEIRINRNTVYGYATSEGIGAYEVKGEMNGVFMKYLKKRIKQPRPLLDMLNKVFLDIERDPKVRDVQIPELRSNLTKQRTLLDPLCKDGHTSSYNHHTFHWRTMHELPIPVQIEFFDLKLQVTIWFDFCGHFTNKVYVFSSVEDLIPTETGNFQKFFDGRIKEEKCQDNEREMLVTDGKMQSDWALSHLAYLRFSKEFECSSPKMCKDDAEGVSLCVLLSHLQKAKVLFKN
ncbi:hypothetical protein Mgra_00004015 [Meloidogyne graminicola]|uniref:CASPASE_P20 domain-containing protein n=1 Tax=Meloidogyne graminicola TaxID=189291 RepID=A0A8S9ZSV5_9BILA|nr:hypothetical protein Mgra_00004015 [Meloidogyne graminicola]